MRAETTARRRASGQQPAAVPPEQHVTRDCATVSLSQYLRFSSQHGDVYSTEKKEKRKKKGNKLFVFITYVLKHTVASLQIINGGGTRGLEDGSPPAGVPSGV